LVSFHAVGLLAGVPREFCLAWLEGDATRTAGEVWVTSPAQRLAVRMSNSNEAGGTPECVVTFRDDAEARLEVLDVLGRVVCEPIRVAAMLGEARVPLRGIDRPGLYWVRVRQSGQSVTTRFVRVR
jgi:hypothetical protein